MNFDVNLLSNLMQMFAGRSQANIGGGMQNYPPTSSGVNAQNSGGHSNQNAPQNRYANVQNNAHNSTDYNNTSGQNTDYRENSGKQAYVTTSFAIENGIGESVRVEQPKRNNETSQANPMLSLLQMMQGGSPTQNGDAMSSMLPILMNLLKKPSTQPNINGNENEKNANNNERKQSDDINAKENDVRRKTEHVVNTDANGNQNINNQFENDIGMSNKDMNSPSNSKQSIERMSENGIAKNYTMRNDTRPYDTGLNVVKYNKTQPSFFKPIAFAGYELMSALCKLYLTSSLHHDRKDICRKER